MMSQPTHESPQNPHLIVPPRPLNAVASRQSWREIPVRVCMLITLGVAIVIVAVAVSEGLKGNDDRRLLREGVLVQARIERIAQASRNVDRTVPRNVDLSFQLPGEADRRELNSVTLASTSDGSVINRGDLLPIYVDPKNIKNWTATLHPPSWLVTLAAPLLLLPLAVILALITFMKRAGIMRLYQSGVAQSASVIEAHRSALVPGQKIAKVSTGGIVLSAAYPDSLGTIGTGQMIDLIVNNAAKPTKAIVARAYAENLKSQISNSK